jgi:hypothetical protein
MRNQIKNVYNFLDVNISDLSVIENPLELKSNNLKRICLYLYRPYVYTGSALNYK